MKDIIPILMKDIIPIMKYIIPIMKDIIPDMRYHPLIKEIIPNKI